MGSRRDARDLAMQVLFHLEFNPGDPEKAFELICENFKASKSIRPFSRDLVLGVCANKVEIDTLISKASMNWRISRMARLDRSILRLSVFEILFLDDIPPRVSIDEALEIAKKFGTEDSVAFINGILDNIYNNLSEQGIIAK